MAVSKASYGVGDGDIMYELKVPDGTYKADNLFWLFITIFKHRFQHLIKDGKFMD